MDALAQAGGVVGDRLPDWLAVPGVRLGIALLILALGVWVSKLTIRLIGRPVARRFERQSVAQTVLRGVRVAIIVGAAAAGFSIAGVQLPSLVVSAAVFSAVAGVILAPLIGSVISGFFVLWDQPFEIGDLIELDDGTMGFVEDITIRYTKILTLDNTFLVIPNGNVRERDVTNYSAEDERTRRSLDVLVTYESDVTEARRLIERAARGCEAVVSGGPDIRIGAARYVASPDCRVHEFGDNGVLLRLRYWVKKPYKLNKVQSTVNIRIREITADADVEMAYPHRHLVFDDTSGVARVDADGRAVAETAEERDRAAKPPEDEEGEHGDDA
ncbi:hypothetical protein GCM10027435_17590 [Haloparvum alkalitolerans]|uniref:mechanosensitive ion channel family protein n=1 Tax=Haloparvum alkalitolerans TaxID=1042953 RepID=UPI003CF329C7